MQRPDPSRYHPGKCEANEWGKRYGKNLEPEVFDAIIEYDWHRANEKNWGSWSCCGNATNSRGCEVRQVSTTTEAKKHMQFPSPMEESGVWRANKKSVGDAPDASHVASHVVARKQKYSKFSCNVHGIPAVRRKCDKGANKDRRFYVCGKEKGQRCDYFVWADEMQKEMDKMKSKAAK